MTDNITNFIKFDADTIETSKGKGRISTLDRDLGIIVRPFQSDNEKAPTHQIFGKSPAGHEIQVGGIWKNTSKENSEYFTMTIKQLNLKANLGKSAGQEDASLQAIISWDQ